MRRLLSLLGLRPEATVPSIAVAASQAQADSEIIGDKPPSRSRTKTSVNRGMPVVKILAAWSLLLTCCQSDGPDPRSSSRHDASQLATEKSFELGGVAMECVLLPPRGIYMGKYEVTNRQFRDYREDRGLPAPEEGFDDPDLPAVNLSWDDARGFCEWETGRSRGRFTVRLPTNEEWDDAAGAEGARLAPGKENLEGPGNDPFPGIAPVGRFPGNRHGLHDMFGNVWEWIRGESHGGSHEDRRLGVMRGGSFASEIELLRDGGARDERPEDSRHFTVGFRVVIVPTRSNRIENLNISK
jgi:formylglycine-generating enzyme required for sulfatase activity